MEATLESEEPGISEIVMASPLTGLVPLIGLVVRVFYLRSEILRGALLIPGLLTDWISCGRKLGYVVLQLIPF